MLLELRLPQPIGINGHIGSCYLLLKNEATATLQHEVEPRSNHWRNTPRWLVSIVSITGCDFGALLLPPSGHPVDFRFAGMAPTAQTETVKPKQAMAVIEIVLQVWTHNQTSKFPATTQQSNIFPPSFTHPQRLSCTWRHRMTKPMTLMIIKQTPSLLKKHIFPSALIGALATQIKLVWGSRQNHV